MTSLFSQNYEISTIPVNNNNHSAALKKKIYLDDEGFLWYSTFNGVVKEMGNSKAAFFPYNFPKEENLKVHQTYSLFKSSDNKLWAGTAEGINILDLKTGESKWISTYYPNSNIKTTFTSIKEDNNGNIWLGTTKNYLYCYSSQEHLTVHKLEEQKTHSIHHSSRALAMDIVKILEDNTLVIRQNHQWMLFKNGQSHVIFDHSKAFSNKRNDKCLLLVDGEVFPSKSSGQYSYESQIYQYKYIPEINGQIAQIPFNDSQYIPKPASDNFYNGLNVIALDYKNLLGLRLEKNIEGYTLKMQEIFEVGQTISNVIYDPSGYFWLHSEAGINKIRYNNLGFKKHLNRGNISCRGLAEDSQGTLYIFTYKGIFALKKGELEFKELDIIKDEAGYKYLKALSYNFYMENDTTLWFYGYHDSLIKLDLKTGQFETFKFPVSKAKIFDLVAIEDSRFMLASTNGLYEFDLKSKTYKNISRINDSINLDNLAINTLYLNKDKSALWIANSGKDPLIKISYATNTVRVFNTEDQDLPLINKGIKVIHEDNNRNIWLGSNKGLQKINPLNNKFKNFTRSNGLTNDNITGILEDEKYLWISTYYGLVKLNKETETLQTFFKEDGLTHNEFNATSNYKSQNGILYFGGLNGLIGFNPKSISQNDKSFKIILSGYEMYDKSEEKNKIYLNLNKQINTFNIPNRQNYLTLSFAINDLLNTNKNMYQYRVKNQSEDWINLGNYNTIQLRGLDPGKHDLEVRGNSSNGNLTNTLTYKIHVTQVFYKKLWFIGLNFMILLVFISIRNARRRKRIKIHYKQKNKIQELESKAMRAQMNPHFIFNTLNGMQSVMILKGEREANKYFTAFSKLLRFTLDMSNSEYILLKDEIAYIKSYLALENLRLDNRLDFSFNIDPKLAIEKYSIPCMLFQPIIENALIHGLVPKKYDLKLSINFKSENGRLIGEVIDNGVGREAAMQLKERSRKDHKSWATHIMSERIKISNAMMIEKIEFSIIDLSTENEPLGTKVVLRIPLKENK